jgi:hypothetical protein
MKHITVSLHGWAIPFTIGQCARDHFPMMDQSKPNDIWFHLQDRPSCHIIASVPDQMSQTLKKAIIHYGIRLSKEQSQYNTKVRVIHARIHELTKTNTEGTVRI